MTRDEGIVIDFGRKQITVTTCSQNKKGGSSPFHERALIIPAERISSVKGVRTKSGGGK